MKREPSTNYLEMNDGDIIDNIENDAHVVAALLEGVSVMHAALRNGAITPTAFRPRRPTDCDPIGAALNEVVCYMTAIRDGIEILEERDMAKRKAQDGPTYRYGINGVPDIAVEDGSDANG
jgi:hypothetical protein